MAIHDRIRLTGLLRKALRMQGFLVSGADRGRDDMPEALCTADSGRRGCVSRSRATMAEWVVQPMSNGRRDAILQRLPADRRRKTGRCLARRGRPSREGGARRQRTEASKCNSSTAACERRPGRRDARSRRRRGHRRACVRRCPVPARHRHRGRGAGHGVGACRRRALSAGERRPCAGGAGRHSGGGDPREPDPAPAPPRPPRPTSCGDRRRPVLERRRPVRGDPPRSAARGAEGGRSRGFRRARHVGDGARGRGGAAGASRTARSGATTSSSVRTGFTPPFAAS